jgi:hypothetical protein
MKKSAKPRKVVLVSAIVIELAGVIIITKAYATGSSPAVGLALLTIGLVFLIIGITKKIRTAGRNQTDHSLRGLAENQVKKSRAFLIAKQRTHNTKLPKAVFSTILNV